MKRKNNLISKDLISSLISDFSSIKVNKTLKGATQDSSNTQTFLVENVLNKNGFQKTVSEANFKAPGFYYINQPEGSQKFPDFRLINVSRKRNIDGEYLFKSINLELKKGRSYIYWNDGFPREDSLYLYSDISGFNLLFTGDSIKAEDREKYTSVCEMMNSMKEIFLKWSGKTTFRFFPRKATKQRVKEGELSSEPATVLLKNFLDFR